MKKIVREKGKTPLRRDFTMLGRLISLGLVYFVFVALAFLVYHNRAQASEEPQSVPHYPTADTELA